MRNERAANGAIISGRKGFLERSAQGNFVSRYVTTLHVVSKIEAGDRRRGRKRLITSHDQSDRHRFANSVHAKSAGEPCARSVLLRSSQRQGEPISRRRSSRQAK